jgi:Flp pilus assembly pilin Flp
MSRTGTLLRDARGASAVEFAVLAPVVALLATVGYAGVVLHGGAVSLETGVAAAARAAILRDDVSPPAEDPGPCATERLRVDMIRCVVRQHICPPGGGFCYADPGWGDLDPVRGLRWETRVEIRAYGDPRNVGRPEPFTDADKNGFFDAGETWVDVNQNGVWDRDSGRTGAGGSGDHVVYRVSFAQRVAHPLLTAALGERLIHTAQVVVRNEPY